MNEPAYGCFLPDLTRFTGVHCGGPGRQRGSRAPALQRKTSGRNSTSLQRIASYRAPLPPRLAR